MASASTHEVKVSFKKYETPKTLVSISYLLVAIGLVATLYGVFKDPYHFWPSYLTAYFYVSCFALGGMFWVSVNNLSKAGWSVGIRRLAEGFTSFFPILLVGALFLLFGLKYLYPWARPEVVAENSLIQAKQGFLNTNFLFIRILVFGAGIIFFAKKIVGNSLKQDIDGNVQYTHSNVAWSVAYIVFFALAFTLFSMDLLMSLLPTWYSTIFGIYCFAGMFQSSLALLVIIMILMRRSGYVSGYFYEDHYHDVGKFLKGFTVFWAYIAFSQFMLIWYANIPEETEYYLMRAQEGWMFTSLSLLFFKFIAPFLLLLPKAAKRNEAWLIAVSILILVMQYIDVYWMVFPNFSETVSIGFLPLGTLALFAGLFLISLNRFYSRNNLVAHKDPRMHEAIHHHVSY